MLVRDRAYPSDHAPSNGCSLSACALNAMATTPEIQRVSDATALYQAAAEVFVRAATEAVRTADRFTVALAGGSTPRGLYGLLADPTHRDRIAWHSVHVFWGDERHVPPDHADSNFRMANEALLTRVPVDPRARG